jgi:hypothetical protein
MTNTQPPASPAVSAAQPTHTWQLCVGDTLLAEGRPISNCRHQICVLLLLNGHSSDDLIMLLKRLEN